MIEYARHCEHVRDMDDIESSANPRWDADYHDYANGLDVLLDPRTASTNGPNGLPNAAGQVNVTPAGDRNEWGRIDQRYTRHSLTGIPGANGRARFSQAL